MRRKKSFRSTSLRLTEIGSPVYLAPFKAGFCSNCAFCSAARFTAGWMVCLLPPACARAALALVATSSAAVLSAKRLAASWAFATGSAALLSLGENLGSTKAKSAAGFSVFSAEAGAAVVVVVAGVAGAEACANCGARLAATDFAAGAGWRWASAASWILRTKLPSGPATNSCWRLAARSPSARSMTTCVLGGTCPSIPMRTSFTPSRSTTMWLCAVAITVLGKSTTMRAGDSSVDSLGASAPFALNSIRNPSWLCATSSLCNRAPAATSLPVVSAAAAIVITTNASSGTKRPSSCFRISLSPHARPFRLHVFPRTRFFEVFVVSRGLNRRSRNLLHYFPRKRLAHPVLQCFPENDGVARDFHHVTVKHRIVLPQKISLIHAVTDHSDETAFGTHHTTQVDGADFQALLAGAATRTAGVTHHRTDERIPSAVGVVLAVGNDRLFALHILAASRNAVAGCDSVRRRIFFGSRSG